MSLAVTKPLGESLSTAWHAHSHPHVNKKKRTQTPQSSASRQHEKIRVGDLHNVLISDRILQRSLVVLIYPHMLTLWPWCLETALTDGQSQDARDRQSLESHRRYVKLILSFDIESRDGITSGWLGPQGGEMAGGMLPFTEEVEGVIVIAERKVSSSHTQSSDSLSRPQIRKDFHSCNPFTNVQRFKWALILPQPKQSSGMFHRPRPPWFGWRMWKTSLFSL